MHGSENSLYDNCMWNLPNYATWRRQDNICVYVEAEIGPCERTRDEINLNLSDILNLMDLTLTTVIYISPPGQRHNAKCLEQG